MASNRTNILNETGTGGNRERGPHRLPRLIGWQGLNVNVPDGWDMTGFSGDDNRGYVRIDDSAEQGLEIKWDTVGKRQKAPDVSVRRESYFRSLRETAKKKRLELVLKENDPPRSAQNLDRTVSGFTWIGDRKAVGAIWYCQECRRVVIAQVLGPRTGGRANVGSLTDGILGSLRCHSHDPEWRTWALYDLHTEIPTRFALTEQQLMNVYLRLTFADKMHRLSVEQWGVANVARRDAYLDNWVAANSRGSLTQARYKVEEADANGHAGLTQTGGLRMGRPVANAVREVFSLHRPATRFNGRAWQCEPSNKIYAVQSLRPGNAPDLLDEIVGRTRCHNYHSGVGEP